jgi:oligopeptide/dipeptide ABC transporter ATP-binding protein
MRSLPVDRDASGEATGDARADMGAQPPLVEVRGLTKHFPARGDGLFGGPPPIVKAVDGIGFTIRRGETLGLVGESGCGKSTVARLLLRLLEPTSGTVIFDGVDLGTVSKERLRQLRRGMQMVFQDPFASLNPRMTVSEIIAEPLRVHGEHRGQEERRVAALLDLVGLSAQHGGRYPHEFSGGQRQRVGIARALALNPKFIVCDEPVSALDVSIQSQVLNLLKDIQREFGIAYLFISHNLSVVKYICDRVGVMYLGRLVEQADKSRLFAAPNHPYTRALLSAIPAPEPGLAKSRIILTGDIPSPINPPSGCRFHTRCFVARPDCASAEPALRDIDVGHASACLLNETTTV